MSSNPTKSEATNAETTKNPKQGSDWLGGPQNGSEIPREAARNPQTGDIQKPTEGVDTQTGSQAKGMGSDGYTKHRFNETPGASDYTKHRFNETPGNGGNGDNGGNASGSGGNETWTGRGKA